MFGEGTQAFVDHAADLRVANLFVVNDILDVVLTVIEVLNQLAEVLEHHLSVGKDLLVSDEQSDVLLRDLSLVLKD